MFPLFLDTSLKAKHVQRRITQSRFRHLGICK